LFSAASDFLQEVSGQALDGFSFMTADRHFRQQRRDHAQLKLGKVVTAHTAELNQHDAPLRMLFLDSQPNEKYR
jgi:hypothetical protein